MRVNSDQPFVIGGYTHGARNIDAVIFGYYDGSRLLYAGCTRNGFTPATRAELHRRLRGLEIAECPFVNLPEAISGRWGEGLTASKMTECRWLQPQVVGQFEFRGMDAGGPPTARQVHRTGGAGPTHRKQTVEKLPPILLSEHPKTGHT
jgi:ATP-dependent DNA ligase